MKEEGFIRTAASIVRNSLVVGTSIVVLVVLFGLASRSSGATYFSILLGMLIFSSALIEYVKREVRRGREE